ncbi:uncharacterized protein LOC142087013 [Calonectris borealis]|uniref:uncharacterized protein LOC142087013 n=1 Tax=Calonectris borealis TaxID=1323832 RepID=UPI003F4C2F2C
MLNLLIPAQTVDELANLNSQYERRRTERLEFRGNVSAELREASAYIFAGLRRGRRRDFGSRLSARRGRTTSRKLCDLFIARNPGPSPRVSPPRSRGRVAHGTAAPGAATAPGRAGPGGSSAGPGQQAPPQRGAAAGAEGPAPTPPRERSPSSWPLGVRPAGGGGRTGDAAPRPGAPTGPHLPGRGSRRPLVAPRPGTGTGRGTSPPPPAGLRRRPPESPFSRRGREKGGGRQKKKKKKKKKGKKKKRCFTRSLSKSWWTQSQRLFLAHRLGGEGETEEKKKKIKCNLREIKQAPVLLRASALAAAEPLSGAAAARSRARRRRQLPGRGDPPHGPARRRQLFRLQEAFGAVGGRDCSAAGQRPPLGGSGGCGSAGVRGGVAGGARKWVPGGVFRPFRGDGASSVCGRTGHPSRGAPGSASPRQPHFVPPLRGARRKARGARVHLPRAQDARPPRGGRAEGEHQKTERVWSFVKKQAKQNAELKK